MLAESYGRAGGGRVTVQGGGSTAGVQAVLSGVAQIGALSRRVTADELRRGLRAHIIAYDVLTVVVHTANPVERLTTDQLRRVFAGEVKNWAEVGGRPGVIRLVSREAGSGSREGFRETVGAISPAAIVLGSAGAIRLAVAADPQAIGYVSLEAARMGGVKAVALNGSPPGSAGYPLVRPLSLVTRGEPAGEAAAFIQFALSRAGQRLVQEEGLVPANAQR